MKEDRQKVAGIKTSDVGDTGRESADEVNRTMSPILEANTLKITLSFRLVYEVIGSTVGSLWIVDIC